MQGILDKAIYGCSLYILGVINRIKIFTVAFLLLKITAFFSNVNQCLFSWHSNPCPYSQYALLLTSQKSLRELYSSLQSFLQFSLLTSQSRTQARYFAPQRLKGSFPAWPYKFLRMHSMYPVVLMQSPSKCSVSSGYWEYIIPKVHCDSYNKRIPNTAESSHCSKSLTGGFRSTSHVPIP